MSSPARPKGYPFGIHLDYSAEFNGLHTKPVRSRLGHETRIFHEWRESMRKVALYSILLFMGLVLSLIQDVYENIQD